MLTQEEKSQALLVWVLSIFFGWLSSLIFFLTSKDKPGVYKCAAQALTWHICVFVAFIVVEVVSFAMTIATHGLGAIFFLLIPLIGLASLIVSIMGAMAANNGTIYEPPVTGKFAQQWFKI